ncbi:MAG: aldo/keto reductase [Deltaproteobacteria bacterium]|nr:aldo/keto reductase [Deltaproteobacteria bacterium]
MEEPKVPKKERRFSRRDFLKITGAAGAGSVAASISKLSGASERIEPESSKPAVVPTRPFGKTGVNVSMLGLGGSQDLMSKQLLLRQAVKMGVTYWDTADSYEGGNSEKAIGNYFEKYPDDRKKVFLVTKTSSSDPDRMNRNLDTSLQRLKTSYVDLFFIHAVSDVKDDIDKTARAWVEKAKAKGKIRFFGFSTHSNMEQCLMDGAELGWIDGIMTSFNYRLMHADSMKKAVAACTKAGIGLTAMKTQAKFFAYFYADIGKESETSSKLNAQFMRKGYTPEQARLKAVWENPDIASICSEMPNMTILQANVAAALNKTKLSFHDKQLLEQYSRETVTGYCAGCARICESAVEENVPISDIMRCLMYSYSYGDHRKATRLFSSISGTTRKQLANIDYSKAERLCPQNISISKVMDEAINRLTSPEYFL